MISNTQSTPRAPRLSPQQAEKLTRLITGASVLTALILTFAKVVAWQMSGSVAMMASLADSVLDLAASLITFFAVRYAVAPPDAEHRFGHGKAEAFAALVQAALVFASAALIGHEALDRLSHPVPVLEGWLGMAVMGLSILVTSGLVFAQTRVLALTGSVAVSGDREHYIADLAANVAAMIGLGAASLGGFLAADAVAGLVVAIWLVYGALKVLREASDHLMDKGLPVEDRARLVELMLKDPQITSVHQLRTRQAGAVIMVQMHVDLDPDLRLVQAHEILVAAEKRLLAEFPNADILLHPDPRGHAEPHGGAFSETHHSHNEAPSEI